MSDNQVYFRHGRRHGLKGLRPNDVLALEEAYCSGYVTGTVLRATLQAFVLSGLTGATVLSAFAAFA